MYPLEQSRRPRSSSPLSINTSGSTQNAKRTSQTPASAPAPLLYDLPTSSPTRDDASSPRSPTREKRDRARRSRDGISLFNGQQGSRIRAATPSAVPAGDLEKFAEHCHAWYFEQSEEAGRLMTSKLETLVASQRPPFVRLQATIRSAYHASVTAKRQAEFKAHLSAIKPGHSLTPNARSHPSESAAREERLQRFTGFVSTWCTVGYPGTKPFFEGLWALMRLQILPESIGGSGQNRIQWEFDDAVFQESAGKDFMLEAIAILKGVLGFDEEPVVKESPTLPSFEPSSLHLRSASLSVPALNSISQSRRISPSIASTTMTNRNSTLTNPFLDENSDVKSTSPPPPPSSYPGVQSTTSDDQNSDCHSEPDDPCHISVNMMQQYLTANAYDTSDASNLRIWTAPDLSNPEYATLLRAFPASVTRRPLSRFNVRASTIDAEEGLRGEGKEIHFGTGTMWIGLSVREPGYQGSMWTRFMLWLRNLFS